MRKSDGFALQCSIDLDARTGLVFNRIESGAYAAGRAVGLDEVLTSRLIQGRIVADAEFVLSRIVDL